MKSPIADLILYQDENIIAINKPSGLLTIPDGFNPSLPNLRDVLNKSFPEVWVVHRLDKQTSGVLLFALDARTHRGLSIQFQNHTIYKQYRLLVKGIPEWHSKLITLPVRINGDRRHRTIIDIKNGKPASTLFNVEKHFSNHSLLSATPHTGYTHQIRAHICAAGFPILGDSLYWKPEAHLNKPNSMPNSPHAQIPRALPIDRLALHAAQITFVHPITNQKISISANKPADFCQIIEILEKSN